MKTGIKIIVFFFIVLFIYAATTKLLDYSKFTVQIGQSSILRPIAWILAFALPIFEIGIAILLLIPKKWLLGLIASTGLMTVFTIYIIWAYFFAPNTPCSCGGIFDAMDWITHLYFNIIVIIMGVIGIYILVKIRKNEEYFSNDL
jgi:uncharacterized membrane protein YphA (DoxX/SURF4 family)